MKPKYIVQYRLPGQGWTDFSRRHSSLKRARAQIGKLIHRDHAEGCLGRTDYRLCEVSFMPVYKPIN